MGLRAPGPEKEKGFLANLAIAKNMGLNKSGFWPKGTNCPVYRVAYGCCVWKPCLLFRKHLCCLIAKSSQRLMVPCALTIR